MTNDKWQNDTLSVITSNINGSNSIKTSGIGRMAKKPLFNYVLPLRDSL